MPLRTLLLQFIGWVLYPAWLAAGALDYFAHRRTHIEHTSGSVESSLHVAQFACIASLAALALLTTITPAIWVVIAVLTAAHSALAYIDVTYTEGRRRIAPIEQFAHEFLDLIPWCFTALLGLLLWSQPTPAGANRALDLRAMLGDTICFAMLGALVLLAGASVFEEWLRTRRVVLHPHIQAKG